MKIKSSQLKYLIKEEILRILNEQETSPMSDEDYGQLRQSLRDRRQDTATSEPHPFAGPAGAERFQSYAARRTAERDEENTRNQAMLSYMGHREREEGESESDYDRAMLDVARQRMSGEGRFGGPSVETGHPGFDVRGGRSYSDWHAAGRPELLDPDHGRSWRRSNIESARGSDTPQPSSGEQQVELTPRQQASRDSSDEMQRRQQQLSTLRRAGAVLDPDSDAYANVVDTMVTRSREYDDIANIQRALGRPYAHHLSDYERDEPAPEQIRSSTPSSDVARAQSDAESRYEEIVSGERPVPPVGSREWQEYQRIFRIRGGR